MKKHLYITFTICILLGILMLISGQGIYKINIKGDRTLITSCPGYAKSGRVVVVKTVGVDDAELHVRFEGIIPNKNDECTYMFFMPDHDITIHPYITSEGYGGS